MITGLTDSGALPVLERVVQYTQARQEIIAHNIANLSTPFFKPVDMPPEQFQASLRDAIDKRRESLNPHQGKLSLRDKPGMRFSSGGMELRPSELNESVLFHDQNNRDLNRIMARLAENTIAHNTAIEFTRNHFSMLETAIRERF